MNEVSIDLHDPSNNAVPKYTVHILDQRPNRDNGRYAAFIVPQGRLVSSLHTIKSLALFLLKISLIYVFVAFKLCLCLCVKYCSETEWLFSTQQGRKKLLLSAKHDRLAIVSMHRGHAYKSWDDVKDELSGSVRNFAPSGLKNQQVC